MSYRPRFVRRSRLRTDVPVRLSDEAPADFTTITSTFLEKLEAAVEPMIAAGRVTMDEAVERIGEIDLAEAVVDELTESIYKSLRKAMPPLLVHLRDGDRRIAARLDQVWGPADRLYRAMAHLAHEVGQSIAAVNHGARTEALCGLHARATRTASEIRLLAMNGFPAAAEARWRSLHELAVVADVIANSAESVAVRYMASSFVENWKDLETYQRTAASIGREPFDDAEVQAARDLYDEVIAAHGLEIAIENGWAFHLFPNTSGKRNSVKFRELEDRARLDHYRSFYRLGSHHVHAGARGSELNMIDSDEGTMLTPGATVYGDIAETCHMAMISLAQVTIALLFHRSADEGDKSIVDDLVIAQTVMRFVDDAGPLYDAAAKLAHQLGLMTYDPR